MRPTAPTAATAPRVLATAALTFGLLATPGLAGAHPAGSDAWDGTYVSRDASDVPVVTGQSDVPIVRQSDNVEFVAHVPVGATSDMQFQRREGPQRLRGQLVDRRLDIVVMGGTATPGLSVIDITDPTNPEVLSTVTCGGFHSDVAVYENYVVQAWDGSNRPCAADDPANRLGVENPMNRGEAGVRVFDLTDPADPVLVRKYGEDDGIPHGVHNVTVNGEAGLVYLNMAEIDPLEPLWGYVDLDDPELPITVKPVRDWSPTAGDGCHDQSIAPTRGLLACAGITASYIWDISEDPTSPTEVAVVPNPGINIHHGSRWTPDEQTLVLGDELAGAAASTPCTGSGTPTTPVGAAWFYDATIAEAPLLNGVFSTSDTDGDYCTTHFYGFQAGTTLMPMGMYDAGIDVVDYGPVADGLPGQPTSHAHFEPADSGFFSAYAWHGYVYGSSFEYGADKDTNAPGRGLWIIEVDGIEDAEPTAVDEGNSWGRWTPARSGQHVTTAARIGLAPADAHTNLPLYALAVAGVLLVAGARRRRAGRA